MGTLKDLLPGIIGLGVGAASPQLGRAGANTISMFDQMQGRKRRQTLEDERMDMSRQASGRAARGEQRAIAAEGRAQKSFEWNSEAAARRDREWAREEDERKRLMSVGPQVYNSLLAEGLDVSEGAKDVFLNPDSNQQLMTLENSVRQINNNTPLSRESADAYAKTLPPGKSVWAPVRVDGTIVKEQLFNPNHPPGSGGSRNGLSTGTTEVINAIQNLKKSKMTLEDSMEDRTAENDKQIEEWREELPQVGGGQLGKGGTVSPDRMLMPDLRDENQNVEMGEGNVQFSEEDLNALFAKYPNALYEINMLMAQGMLQPGFLDPILGNEEVVTSGPSAQVGAGGATYSNFFKPDEKKPKEAE